MGLKRTWKVADCFEPPNDLEGMNVGPVADRRIGAVLGHLSVESQVKACEGVTIDAPVQPELESD